MKRLRIYIAILWLFSILSGLLVHNISGVENETIAQVENESQQEEKESDELKIEYRASEAILSVFSFSHFNPLSLIPKVFFNLEKEETPIFFEIRDFSVQIRKKLFTRVIQVHGP